jgi:hypothetical protein
MAFAVYMVLFPNPPYAKILLKKGKLLPCCMFKLKKVQKLQTMPLLMFQFVWHKKKNLAIIKMAD